MGSPSAILNMSPEIREEISPGIYDNRRSGAQATEEFAKQLQHAETLNLKT